MYIFVFCMIDILGSSQKESIFYSEVQNMLSYLKFALPLCVEFFLNLPQGVGETQMELPISIAACKHFSVPVAFNPTDNNPSQTCAKYIPWI